MSYLQRWPPSPIQLVTYRQLLPNSQYIAIQSRPPDPKLPVPDCYVHSAGFHSKTRFGSTRLKGLLIAGYIRWTAKLKSQRIPSDLNQLCQQFYGNPICHNISFQNINPGNKIIGNIIIINKDLQIRCDIEPRMNNDSCWLYLYTKISNDISKIKLFFNAFCRETQSEIKTIIKIDNWDKWFCKTYSLNINYKQFKLIYLYYYIEVLSISYDPYIYGDQWIDVKPRCIISQITQYTWNVWHAISNRVKQIRSDNFGIDNNFSIQLIPNASQLQVSLYKFPWKLKRIDAVLSIISQNNYKKNETIMKWTPQSWSSNASYSKSFDMDYNLFLFHKEYISFKIEIVSIYNSVGEYINKLEWQKFGIV